MVLKAIVVCQKSTDQKVLKPLSQVLIQALKGLEIWLNTHKFCGGVVENRLCTFLFEKFDIWSSMCQYNTMNNILG